MADPVRELNISDYIEMFKRRWFGIALATLVGVGIAAGAAALATPQYRAEARVLIEAAPTADLGDSSNLPNNIRDRNLQNEVSFALSDRVTSAAAAALDGEFDISVRTVDGSDTLVFSATSVDPVRAAEVANTVADTYVSERSEALVERFADNEAVVTTRLSEIAAERSRLQTELIANPGDQTILNQIVSLDAEESRRREQLTDFEILSQFNQTASVSMLNLAQEPQSAFAPSWVRNIALGLVAGGIIGVGLALLMETLDDTIISKRDLEEATDFLPVLGAVPPPWKGRRRRANQLVAARTGAFTESFRSLRSAIELGQQSGEEIRSILVTSASPGEGKSTVSAHLALSFARAGEKVLVIDADMHNPTQHEFFAVENVSGLAEHLSNIGEAEIVMEQSSGDNLIALIPAGSSSHAPAELLTSQLAEEFILKLSAVYDLVIIDSPPLRPVADTLPLARIADVTLLVVRRNVSTYGEVRQAMELLARAQTRPIGTIMCGADKGATGYGYGYGYGDVIKSRRLG